MGHPLTIEGYPRRDEAGTRALELGGELGARFRTAWLTDEREADPVTSLEFLPTRLARACVQVLGVDGAGLSVLTDEFRVPLGASDENATQAEKLQFTTGEGPCLQAAHLHRPASAADDDLRTKWPVFAEQLFALTPYRAVMSLPVGHDAEQLGALDLYWTDPMGLRKLPAADAITVTEQIHRTLTLSTAVVVDEGVPAEPAWLRGPVPRTRMGVWIAVGVLMSDLDVFAPDALALLRAYAFSHDSTVDDIAHQLNRGALNADELRP